MIQLDISNDDLLNGVEKNEFVLYYQPQFNLVNSQLDALEALIRWNHPEYGLLQPAAFLSQAEESGAIVAIGEWVLRTACAQNKAWRDKGLPGLRIAVNVASQQIEQPEFVDLVTQILEHNQLPAHLLELELTENIILHHEDVVVSVIRQLRQLGVSIALDDFGTGYSSISHLKKIPVDRIKIDKTFVDAIHQNKSDATIVRAIITLASGLNLQVLAEGVETLKQLQTLLYMECKEVQGFYFSEPLNAHDIERILFEYFKK